MEHDSPTWTSILTAVGSIGTAIAATIALVALINSVCMERSERQRQHTGAVRSDLSILVHDSRNLFRIMNEGSPLIVAVSRIHDELIERLGTSPTMDAATDHFADVQLRLSIVADGLESTSSMRIYSLLNSFQRTSARFQGQLIVLAVIGDLTDDLVVGTVFSVSPFMEIFESISNTPQPSLNEIRSSVQAAYTNWYRDNMLAISENIDVFVQALCAFVLSLSDDEIYSISRFISQDTRAEISASKTYSGDIRILLEGISETLKERDTTRVWDSFHKLEDALSSLGHSAK